MKALIYILPACFIGTAVRAQEDTTRTRTVEVMSTFKPVLRNASKINFNASLPPADNTPPTLQYNIPTQNLYFAYMSAGLRPLPLQGDTNGINAYSDYVKLGFGNFATPYAGAGFSFGGNKSLFNIFADHISSQGNIQYQDDSHTEVEIDGRITPGAAQVYGKAGFKLDDFDLYGYNHTLFNYTESQVEQNFQTFKASLGVRNTSPNEYGFSYDPHADFSVFRDGRSGNEINGLLSVPLRKEISDNFAFKVNVAADLTYYTTDSLANGVSNDIFYLTPVIVYHNEHLTLNAGINPSWDNNAGGKFTLYPAADLSLKLAEPFSLIVGWNGYNQKNSYQYLESINPYLSQPLSEYNTEVWNTYAGIKGSLGPHITYLAKVGSLVYRNLPLFVNDSISGKSFYTLEEYQLKNLQLHGELGFTAPGHFSVTAEGDINNFYSQKTYAQPYGMPTAQLTAKLRWQPIKDLTFKADLFTWSGPWYQTASKSAQKQTGAFDLSGGVEFLAFKNIGIWLDCNNILNSQYQRWNQYEVLGFNFVGGIVFSFGQNKQ